MADERDDNAWRIQREEIRDLVHEFGYATALAYAHRDADPFSPLRYAARRNRRAARLLLAELRRILADFDEAAEGVNDDDR